MIGKTVRTSAGSSKSIKTMETSSSSRVDLEQGWDDKGPNEEELKQQAAVKLYWYVGSWPYISSGVDLAAAMPKLGRLYKEDFCWASCYRPEFVAELMYRGFLPMALAEEGVEILLPKLHVNRCLVMFADVHKPHGSTLKKSKRFDFSADTCFADVAAGIVEQHGENWFYPRLVQTFTHMNQKAWFGGKVRVHSFEVWKDGELVAGECGYSCGRVYTSLSGFSRADSAGTVQMYAMVSHLKGLGFTVWDLGMHLGYKEKEFGGKEFPRMEFLALLESCRDIVVESPIRLDPRISAKDMLLRMSPNHNSNEEELPSNDKKQAKS